MTAVARGAPRVLDRSEVPMVLVAAAVAVVLGALAGAFGLVVPLAVVGFALFVLVAARPHVGAYLYLVSLPVLAGLARGGAIPALRPQEALHVTLLAAVGAGALVRWAAGATWRIRVTRVDVALLVMAALASAWPIARSLAVGERLTTTDVMSTVPLWRYFGLYVMFRVAIRTAAQVRVCLVLVVAGAAVVGVIAIGQSLGVAGIGRFVDRVYPLTEGGVTARGTSTLGNSIAVGDYLNDALAVVLVWIGQRALPRAVTIPAAVVLFGGVLGTGQFSAWVATVIVVAVVVRADRAMLRRLAVALPLAVVALAVAWPVVALRFANLSHGALPPSWRVRLDNITTFYLPRLGGFRFVTGVRPDSVLLAPETWRQYIYLESGYLWLLWVGGIPLLFAFAWWMRVTLRSLHDLASQRRDDVGVAAVAARAALWSLALLMLLDSHLTIRGGADVLFVLVALASNRLVPAPDPAPEASLR